MLADLGPLGDMAQPVEIHVGAAVDRDQRAGALRFAHRIGLEAREADRARRLGDGAGILEDVLHRRADLVGRDGDDFVEQFAAEPERLLAGLPHRDAVGEEPDLIEHDALARRDGAGHGGGVFRLDADHLDLGPQELGVDRDAGREPAAADRHEDRLDRLGMLAQDFHADRALAGDDIRVVIGMDEGQTLLGFELAGMAVGLVEALAMQHDAPAEAAHRLNLDVRRGARHHDGRLDAELLCRQRHALRMIAGGGADHAALGLDRGETRDLVVGAAQLEREDGLQILVLEERAAAEPGGQARQRIERAFDRNVIDARPDDLADVVLHGRPVLRTRR